MIKFSSNYIRLLFSELLVSNHNWFDKTHVMYYNNN